MTPDRSVRLPWPSFRLCSLASVTRARVTVRGTAVLRAPWATHSRPAKKAYSPSCGCRSTPAMSGQMEGVAPCRREGPSRAAA
jgi:hypothetical protein